MLVLQGLMNNVGHFVAVGESNVAMDPAGNPRVAIPRDQEEHGRMLPDIPHLVGECSTVRSSCWGRTVIR